MKTLDCGHRAYVEPGQKTVFCPGCGGTVFVRDDEN